MDPESRLRYPSLSEEQWLQHGYLDSAGLAPSNVTNEVHSVFSFSERDSRGLSNGSKWTWILQAGQTEERLRWLLRPVLQLASLI